MEAEQVNAVLDRLAAILGQSSAEVVDAYTQTATWQDLKIVVRGGRSSIEACLKAAPEEHRVATALALSVAHWHPSEREWIWAAPSNRTRGKYCALCLNFQKGYFNDDDCAKCPLGKMSDFYHRYYFVEYLCRIPGGIFRSSWMMTSVAFRKWHFYRSADKLYNLLVQLYTKEWERLHGRCGLPLPKEINDEKDRQG